MPNTPGFFLVILFDVSMFILNVTLGVSGIFRHRSPWLWGFNFLASFIIGIFTAQFVIRAQRMESRIHREAEERLQQIADRRFPMNIDEVAMANLRQVVKVTGAEVKDNGLRADIEVGGHKYAVIPNHMYRLNSLGSSTSDTCLQYQRSDMPLPERIAATLLLLHNDPKLFDQWCKQDGYHA